MFQIRETFKNHMHSLNLSAHPWYVITIKKGGNIHLSSEKFP